MIARHKLKLAVYAVIVKKLHNLHSIGLYALKGFNSRFCLLISKQEISLALFFRNGVRRNPLSKTLIPE